MQGSAPTLGVLSFLSFGFSVIAAVLAIDMYKLLRTGEFGRTWRLLIIASVMFALLQVLRMAEFLDFQAMQDYHLSEITELCFVMTLAYAFYLQRKVFTREHKSRHVEEMNTSEDDGPEYSMLDEIEQDEPDEPDDVDEWKEAAPARPRPLVH